MKYSHNEKGGGRQSSTKSDTLWVNIQDAPHSRHSYRSCSHQSIGYNKESSDRCLNDPKEHKEKRDLRENWLRLCYLLDIVHPQSVFPIFLIIHLNSDIDLLDLTKFLFSHNFCNFSYLPEDYNTYWCLLRSYEMTPLF